MLVFRKALGANVLLSNRSSVLLSGPINREMRHLISTLQTHNQQLKGEVVKYKLRLRETQAELNQVIQAESVKNQSEKLGGVQITTLEGSHSKRSVGFAGSCFKGQRHSSVAVEHRDGLEG